MITVSGKFCFNVYLRSRLVLGTSAAHRPGMQHFLKDTVVLAKASSLDTVTFLKIYPNLLKQRIWEQSYIEKSSHCGKG